VAVTRRPEGWYHRSQHRLCAIPNFASISKHMTNCVRKIPCGS